MRSRARRATVFPVVVAVLLGIGGCAFGDIPTKKYAAAPSSEAPIDTPWMHRVAEPVVAPAPIQSEAVKVFGREAAEAAYAETVEFASDTTFDELLLVPSPYRGKFQFLLGVSRMTADMAGEYNAIVDAAWDGDQDAADTMFAYRFFFDDDPDYTVQDTGPLVLDHVIEDPQLVVERGLGFDRPEVSFIQRGDVRMRVDGEDVLVRFTKTATYWLAPALPGNSFRWRIDGCDIQWTSADPVPDTGTY
jgi:hypothetical protein